MAEEIKLTQDEAPESRNFIHAFIEEDIGPGAIQCTEFILYIMQAFCLT